MCRGIKEELAEMARNVGDTLNESAPDQLSASAEGKRKPGVYLVLVLKDKRDTEADLLLRSSPRPKITRSSHNSHMLVGPRRLL